MGSIVAYAVGAISVLVIVLKISAVLAFRPKLRRVQELPRLLDQGRLEEHLEKCEALLNSDRKAGLLYMLVLPHYADHLVLVGRWDEAFALLSARSEDARLPRIESLAREQRLLYVYLLQGKVEDAKVLRESCRAQFDRAKSSVSTFQHVRFILAVYEFYLGDLHVATDMLRHLAGESPPWHERAQLLYFLGCAEYQLGRTSDARVHLAKAAELGEGTFVPQAVEYFVEQNRMAVTQTTNADVGIPVPEGDKGE